MTTEEKAEKANKLLEEVIDELNDGTATGSLSTISYHVDSVDASVQTIKSLLI